MNAFNIRVNAEIHPYTVVVYAQEMKVDPNTGYLEFVMDGRVVAAFTNWIYAKQIVEEM